MPVTFLAEGRPCVVGLVPGQFLQPPGFMPLWRPFRSVVVVVNHGALTVPSGFVPGGGEVDLELPEGLDCIPKSVVEVLPANVQGPGCNFLSRVDLLVIRVVYLAYF